MMEFHISGEARNRYQFSDTLFSFNGNVVFADMPACRRFAHQMNLVREADKNPDRAVHAGSLFAMGLIDEASHVLIARYREQFDKDVMADALSYFGDQTSPKLWTSCCSPLSSISPARRVMRGEETPAAMAPGLHRRHSPPGGGARRIAASVDRQPQRGLSAVRRIVRGKAARRANRLPPGDAEAAGILCDPAADSASRRQADEPGGIAARAGRGRPRSLREQLDLVRQLWKPLLGDRLDRHLQIAGEILHEEELAIWMQFNTPAAMARRAAEEAARRRREAGMQQWPSIESTAQVPVFGDPQHEYEKFSADTAWMPTTVMIAKSTWVWLAQLSRFYGRHIHRLDQIPDEELQTLADRGMNTLWLIGIWERSRASKTIKLLCGNQDAVASAYSLFDYRIADDLGGEAAYINLRDRAYRQGIRLASDMVPNHMGIDSPWVVEHPEWFISRWESPYPAYSFEGPDLSADGRVEIKIDDHYYTQTDAAVVFRRRDKSSGETRYIYHGNDGTSFPWNDTAQLDYLNPAVREQVIQTILHVARLFPVIRFDAAMTLAKRHFHRLWFPGPGSSGAIPSRAEYSMSEAEFDRSCRTSSGAKWWTAWPPKCPARCCWPKPSG